MNLKLPTIPFGLSRALFTTTFLETTVYDAQETASVYKIPVGNYCLSSLASVLNNILKNGEGVKVETNSPQGGLEIFNPQNKKIQLNNYLASLLGIKKRLQPINYIKRFTKFNNYFIHCDLLDKDENLFNGNPSIVLSCFEIVGKPFEKVNYQSTFLRKISPSNYITSMRIYVTDENGEMIDFNNLPLKFEIEFL